MQVLPDGDLLDRRSGRLRLLESRRSEMITAPKETALPVPDPAEPRPRSTLVPPPASGRTFRARRGVRLSDADPSGRLRLDAVARYLQDVASDDVAEAGWRSDEHLWLVRRTEIHVLQPVLYGDQVELITWASGAGISSAARRTTLAGDRGGLIEAESIWIHLDRSLRPARLRERFTADYAPSTGGRRVTPRLELPDPPEDAAWLRWPLRVTDADVLGHVNNAAYWEAIEQVLTLLEAPVAGGLEAIVEFRQPVDLEDEVVLRYASRADGVELGFVAGGEVRAVAVVRAGAVA
jgi:acyl-ACP thioesterase